MTVLQYSEAKFEALLHPHFRIRDLEESPATIFGLWADFTIAYVNPAWRAFADANSGQPTIAERWGVGAHYLNAIAPVLRPFYERLLQNAPSAGTSQHPVSHVYDCSSAGIFRRFNMQVYALPARTGFVIVNALVVESPHDPVTHAPHAANRSNYADRNGSILQCSHCRLVQQILEPSRWDWVPSWVAMSPPETSHGLCPVCFEYYYPADATESQEPIVA